MRIVCRFTTIDIIFPRIDLIFPTIDLFFPRIVFILSTIYIFEVTIDLIVSAIGGMLRVRYLRHPLNACCSVVKVFEVAMVYLYADERRIGHQM